MKDIEIISAIKNAKAQGYDEIRIDLKHDKITPIRRGPGVRVDIKRHVRITKISRS